MRVGIPTAPEPDDEPQLVFNDAGTRRFEVYQEGRYVRVLKPAGVVEGPDGEPQTSWEPSYVIVNGICDCPGYKNRGECRHVSFLGEATRNHQRLLQQEAS